MKTKRVKKQSVHIALIASIVMCFLFISKGYSSIFEITPIETKGTWNNSNEDNKIERSLPTIPISAYLSGNFINIQNINRIAISQSASSARPPEKRSISK